MPKPKAKKKKLPAKNPSDPIELARSVVEHAIGESLTDTKPPNLKRGPSPTYRPPNQFIGQKRTVTGRSTRIRPK